MFRNPRENAVRTVTEQVLPSTGRPPTPPSDERSVRTAKDLYLSEMASGASSMNPAPITRMSMLGVIPQTKITSARKNVVKQNQSILNFFGRTEKKEILQQDAPPISNDLFFEESTPTKERSQNGDVPAQNDRMNWASASPESSASRFNETTTPVKKRRIDPDDTPSRVLVRTPPPVRRGVDIGGRVGNNSSTTGKPLKQRGGFVDDSSDDEDDLPDTPFHRQEAQADQIAVEEAILQAPSDLESNYVEVTSSKRVPLKPPDEPSTNDAQVLEDASQRPPLTRQGTSGFQVDEFGPEDFDDEFFPEGEEFLERQYMEEQLAMERAFDDDSKSESGTEGARTPQVVEEVDEIEEAVDTVQTCPMCNGSMKGLSEVEASNHVNACLDGTAKPLPSVAEEKEPPQKPRPTTPQPGHKRFQRAAIARPAQANPFSGSAKGETKSAFSQLMSGHAEDRAWAEAAVNETQSRGKPAYQRTCPFYKIMPGLYICVDAFRYGKVEGQNAYFLSHFHSDHYIGLTSSWCHGPIYGSKVTCNLMRQQLRVDPKWIVPLEFEKKVEVPNTQGVFVTMIPANHCPGSSLYLFEKVMGKNRDGSVRTNRILHCGDFRACPAHVHHPLLRPEVMDAVTGQTRNQQIDTCYLDTTYLTPKYAFPSQHDVIDACAQMCISLSKEIVDSSDAYEQAKVERAGSTMKKFLEAGSAENSPVKKQEDDEQDVKPRLRGKLLVVVGTYSIGKERICLGIARALKSKIYAPPPKMRICRALEDEELNSFLTPNPFEAQVHMQMLMEIRAETLHDYLVTMRPHFSRVVGFRPTGWSYRPPSSRFTENPAISTVLHSDGWKSRFTMKDLVPQRGSTRESNCFGVPYSEHSSFRELTMFVCALRIGRVIPTVNVGSARSREKMKSWIEKWETEKRKNGLFKVENGAEGWGSGDGQLRYGV